jgi:signal transduction histidine kinase
MLAIFVFCALLLFICRTNLAQPIAPRETSSSTTTTNIAEVIALASPVPDSTHRIELDATVWYSDSTNRRVVLSDGSGAAQFEADWIGSVPQPGQRIHLSGVGSVERVGTAFRLGRKNPLVDNRNMRSVSEKSGSIFLEAGRHPIAVDYFHLNGKAELALTYEGPGITRQRIPESALFQGSGVGTGLTCRYYEGTWPTLPDFSTLTPLKTGTVRDVDFTLARNKDEVGLGFGLTFEGEIEVPRGGAYTFFLRSRDGSLLSVGKTSFRLEVIGTNAFPAPHPILIGQSVDALNRFWAEVEGDASFVARRTDGALDVELCEGAASLHVQIADETLEPEELINRRVLLRGYCEAALDPFHRTIPSVLLVPGRAQIEWKKSMAEQVASANDTNNPPLTLSTIHSLRQLSTSISAPGLPFRVQGVVTCVQRDHDAFVLQDATAALYMLNSPQASADLPDVREFVEVEGITGNASNRGTARVQRMKRLGWGLMPEPVRPSWDQLLAGSVDSQYVEIRGIIDTFFHRANGWSHLEFRTQDGVVRIDVRRAGIRPGTIESHIGSVIRFRACVFSAVDIATQRIKVGGLRMSDMDIFVEEAASLDPFSIPRKRVSELTRFDSEANTFRRAKVSGQIIFVRGNDHFVMDGAEGMRFSAKPSPPLKPGDLVDVVGFPQLSGAALFMRGARVRQTGHKETPNPRLLQPEQLIGANNDSTLIQIQGTLAYIKESHTNLTLEIHAGPYRFISRLSKTNETSMNLRVGSRLELTGVYCSHGGYTAFDQELVAADLLLRSPGDIRVLKTPPWWTLKRLGVAIAVLGALTAAMLLWVYQLQRKVEERTREIRKLNSNLEDRATALELANKELESFSYSVSHDLRAPLRSIDGFSRALLEDYCDKLDAEGKEDLQTIRNASQRMGHLIDDMLALAKVSRSEIHPTPVNLSALAQTVAMELQMADAQRRVEFVITEGLTAHADPRLMRVVLENLFGNAWKFTAHQPDARIEFGATEHKGVPAYFVRDNGVGFDMEFVHKLFGAFQRLHTNEEFPGTGIGLATVQRIIHRQGGKVWAESVLNQGATFYFTLAHS